MSRRKGEDVQLRVHINNSDENLKEQLKAKERGFTYHANSVTTSKYTFYNFMFINLTQQFTRLANVYFLVIALLQLLTPLSPTGRYSTAAPLALVRFYAYRCYRMSNSCCAKPAIPIFFRECFHWVSGGRCKYDKGNLGRQQTARG